MLRTEIPVYNGYKISLAHSPGDGGQSVVCIFNPDSIPQQCWSGLIERLYDQYLFLRIAVEILFYVYILYKYAKIWTRFQCPICLSKHANPMNIAWYESCNHLGCKTCMKEWSIHNWLNVNVYSRENISEEEVKNLDYSTLLTRFKCPVCTQTSKRLATPFKRQGFDLLDLVWYAAVDCFMVFLFVCAKVMSKLPRKISESTGVRVGNSLMFAKIAQVAKITSMEFSLIYEEIFNGIVTHSTLAKTFLSILIARTLVVIYLLPCDSILQILWGGIKKRYSQCRGKTVILAAPSGMVEQDDKPILIDPSQIAIVHK